MCNKLSKSAYLLFKLSHIVSRKTVLSAYHGFVASTLRYGIIFWGNCTDREIVFRAQKRCIRSMCGMKVDESCTPFFKSLKILTFPSLYIFEVAVFVKMNPNLFAKVSQVRQRVRSQYINTLCLPKAKKAILRKSIVYMGPKIYNKIPNDIKILNLHCFKYRLHQLLIEKCYYSIGDYLMDEY